MSDTRRRQFTVPPETLKIAEEFLTAVREVEIACGKEIPLRLAQLWWKHLNDLPLGSVIGAIDWTISERKFHGLPMVGEIRSKAVELMQGPKMTPEEAFSLCRKVASRYGLMQATEARETLGEQVWKALDGIGGWKRFCDSPVDERAALYAQFRDAWQRQLERDQSLAIMPKRLRIQNQVRTAISNAIEAMNIPEGGETGQD